jgi:hypothetical protein
MGVEGWGLGITVRSNDFTNPQTFCDFALEYCMLPFA